MKLHTITLIAALLSCLGCKDDGPEVFLTIVYNGDAGGPIDRWYFATDDDGNVLDAVQLEVGGELQFMAVSPPPTFNVTVYNNETGGSPQVTVIYRFVTYAHIARGSTLRWDHSQVSLIPPDVKGTGGINVKNCNKFTGVTVSDAYARQTKYSDLGTSVSLSLPLRQTISNILVSSHKTLGEPVYGWVYNVPTFGTREADFTSLTPFPKTISVPFPGGSFLGIVEGTMGNPGFYYTMGFLSASYAQTQSDVAKLGYLEGYDEYAINVSNFRSLPLYNRSSRYYKRGKAMPEQVLLQDNDLIVSDPSIANFSFTYNNAYDYSVHRWKDNLSPGPDVYWEIYAPTDSNPSITVLPEAFKAKYPALSLDKLVYYESAFFRHPDGYSFAQFVNLQFWNLEPTPSETWYESFTMK